MIELLSNEIVRGVVVLAAIVGVASRELWRQWTHDVFGGAE